jgi:hypothetical protein
MPNHDMTSFQVDDVVEIFREPQLDECAGISCVMEQPLERGHVNSARMPATG